MQILSQVIQGAAAVCLLAGAWVLLEAGGVLIAAALILAVVGAVMERKAT